MKTYISLLRGINVSGQKKIPMEQLRAAYDDLGFQNVTTYVQSGNVVFRGKEARTGDVAQKISSGILKEFGFDVPVIVLTPEDLLKAVRTSPFNRRPEPDRAFQHITFLFSAPADPDLQPIEDKKQGREEVVLSGKRIYLFCPHGYGKSKLSNNLIETKLKVVATTRNWKTVNELLRITQNIQTHR